MTKLREGDLVRFIESGHVIRLEIVEKEDLPFASFVAAGSGEHGWEEVYRKKDVTVIPEPELDEEKLAAALEIVLVVATAKGLDIVTTSRDGADVHVEALQNDIPVAFSVRVFDYETRI